MTEVYRYTTKCGLRAVLFYDRFAWVGICLETDIGAQANSLDEAARRLDHSLDIHDQITTELGGAIQIGPSPKKFHDMWNNTSLVFDCLGDERQQ